MPVIAVSSKSSYSKIENFSVPLQSSPDCTSTSYGQTVTAVPFRQCDNRNLGISTMCDFSSDRLANPPIFGAQVKRAVNYLLHIDIKITYLNKTAPCGIW